MPVTIKDPVRQIEEGNPWYTDDQFAVQLGTPSSKFIVENRWRIFSKAINLWVQRNQTDRPRSSIHILDAGCGDGINLFGLSQIIERHGWDAKLFGTDYNPLRLARARCIAGVHGLQQASLYALPFQNEAFEVVLCNHVLEHIYDDILALNELHRVLNKNGILILAVPNEGCLIAKIRNNIIQPSIGKNTDHINFYTKKTLTIRLQTTGFRVLHVEREGFFAPHLRLNSVLIERNIGITISELLQRLIPSQCAGLIALSVVDEKK